MKDKKKAQKKLRLNRETVRVLTEEQLQLAVGGKPRTDNGAGGCGGGT